MGNRRFAQPISDDDDEDAPVVFVRPKASAKEANSGEGGEDDAGTNNKRRRRKIVKQPPSDQGAARLDEEEENGEEEEELEDAKPIGEVVGVSDDGSECYFEAFEFDGNRYELEDPVLLSPEKKDVKPFVAIIKDIARTKSGSIMVTGQWLYRPEETEKKGGGSWQSHDKRELFHSFHYDDFPAESVMDKCVLYFIPTNKQLPSKQQHPGFIVQKVYDTVEKKLWKLTDKDYEDDKQHEIDLLVQKTLSYFGDLPDIEPEEAIPDQEESLLKRQRSIRRRNVSPLDVSSDEEAAVPQSKAETPGGGLNSASEYVAILAKFDVLTGNKYRDWWLDKLLQGVQYICDSEGSKKDSDIPGGPDGSEEKENKDSKPLVWPDDAVSAVTALEKASHDAFCVGSRKYNQKLRQLDTNLRDNAFLACRLLRGELEPSKILGMLPKELKEGFTAEETTTNEPEEPNYIQMIVCICASCGELKKVGVKDIYGGRRDGYQTYQLECTSCGHSWPSSMDEVSMLTINGPGSVTSVRVAPLATSKFGDVEKQLNSPRGKPGKPVAANDGFKRSTAASMGNKRTPSSKPEEEGSEAPKVKGSISCADEYRRRSRGIKSDTLWRGLQEIGLNCYT